MIIFLVVLAVDPLSFLVLSLDCKSKTRLEGGWVGNTHGTRRRQGDLGSQITGKASTQDVIAIELGLEGTHRGKVVRHADTMDRAKLITGMCRRRSQGQVTIDLVEQS